MEKKYFSLETRDESRIARVFQVILGIACLAVDGYWLIFSIKSEKLTASMAATSIFLLCFGAYLAWIGFGYGHRYIEFREDCLLLRRNPFLPPLTLGASDIEKIDIYPLKFIVRTRNQGRILTRLGVTDYEKIERVKDELLIFAEAHSIGTELINEMQD